MTLVFLNADDHFDHTDRLLRQVSVAAFECQTSDPEIDRANQVAQLTLVTLYNVRRGFERGTRLIRPAHTTNDDNDRFHNLEWHMSATNRNALLSASYYWRRPPKRKTVRQSSPRPLRRFHTTYVENIGWLTPREAAWFDSDDDTQLHHTDTLPVSVDYRFNPTARFTNLGEGLPQPQWADNGKEIRPRQVPWVHEFE